jgi:hypothetical protein
MAREHLDRLASIQNELTQEDMEKLDLLNDLNTPYINEKRQKIRVLDSY